MLARKLTAASGGAGLDPDAITLIAAMTTPPSAARQRLISDHIVALKDAGIWALLDIYYVMAAHDEQASRLNWKNPAAFTLEANGVITFTADRGWQGDGSSGYLDTGWIPSVNGVNYQLNSASFGGYSRTDIAEDSQIMGVSKTTTTQAASQLLPRRPANVFLSRINQLVLGGTGGASANSLGLFVARRSASNSHQLYKNGVLQSTSADTPTALPPFSFYISAQNVDGAAVSFSTRQLASAFTGAAMSESQQLALYNAQQTGYLAAVGAAV